MHFSSNTMRALTTSIVAAYWCVCWLGSMIFEHEQKHWKITKRGREEEEHSVAMEDCQYLVNLLTKEFL